MAEVMSLMTDLIDYGRVSSLPPSVALKSFLYSTVPKRHGDHSELDPTSMNRMLTVAQNGELAQSVDNQYILGNPLSATLFQVLTDPMSPKDRPTKAK